MEIMRNVVFRKVMYGIFILLVLQGFAKLSLSARPVYTSMVYPGSDGKLVYVPDEAGNTIPDYSNAGYMGGGVALP